MTIAIANVETSTDSFGGWVTRTNQALFAIKTFAVTTQSNTALGNAAVSGWFTANVFNVPNTGIVSFSTSTSNAIANSTTLLIQTSSSSNTVYNANGISVNGGAAILTSTQAAIGSSILNSANITANDIYSANSVQVGVTKIANTFTYTYTANSRYINVSNAASFGDNEANVYVTRKMVEVYDNPLGTYVVNAKMTATDLWITNIHANTIWANTINCNVLSVNTITSNVYFTGANVAFLYPLKLTSNVSLTGNALSFSHSWVGNDNRSFFYNAAGNASWITRNLYKALDNSDVAGNTSGQYLRMGETKLEFGNFKGATTGGTPTLLEQFRVDETLSYFANSFLGIGITGNGINERLVVNGAIRVLGSTSGSIKLQANAAAGAYTLTLPGDAGLAGQLLTTDGSGKLSWFTIPNIGPTYDLQVKSLGVGTGASGVTGEIRATDNITSYYSSDERLKENVLPIMDAIAKVNAIRGVEFDWTDDYIATHGGEDGTFIRKHDVGVIAQEIEQVLPEVVTTREDGTKAVKYDRIVALLIEAIKDLSKEVDRLKNPYKVNEWQ
jgi:hypothetical protein